MRLIIHHQIRHNHKASTEHQATTKRQMEDIFIRHIENIAILYPHICILYTINTLTQIKKKHTSQSRNREQIKENQHNRKGKVHFVRLLRNKAKLMQPNILDF